MYDLTSVKSKWETWAIIGIISISRIAPCWFAATLPWQVIAAITIRMKGLECLSCFFFSSSLGKEKFVPAADNTLR